MSNYSVFIVIVIICSAKSSSPKVQQHPQVVQMMLFDHGYHSVPQVRHNLQLDAFTSQVVEKQLGTRNPLGMDAACQSHIKLNRESTVGLHCTYNIENNFKIINIPGTCHIEDNIS